MLELLGTAASRTSRVLWTLEELGLDYRHVSVDHRRGENKEGGFLALSPTGQIPILKDGETIVRQSLAINLHLVFENAPNALLAGDAAMRAAALEWSLWAATEIEPHSFFRLTETAKPAEEQDAAGLARAETATRRALDYLEGSLEGRTYLVGEQFTIADINAVGPLEYLQRSAFALDAWPRVQVWLARCQERPAYKTVLAMKAAA
jgi:glutathione S-transferase